MKTTVVIGASPNPSRYAYLAVNKLRSAGKSVRALGVKPGKISDVQIEIDRPDIKDVDTITLYIGPKIQAEWKTYILQLQPRRVIFNPGTESPSFAKELELAGVEVLIACTLVMLSTGQY